MKILSFFLFSCLLGYSQNRAQLEVIQSKSNQIVLSQLKSEFDSLHVEREKRIALFLDNNPSFERKSLIGSKERELYDVQNNGELLYLETSNLNSSITSRANRLYSGGSLDLNVQGLDMKVGVWDGGQVKEDHAEFVSFKVVNWDFTPSPSNHATHVMGTIIAAGINSNVRGIAFDAIGDSYDWNNDYSEMTAAAAAGLLVSNHSYGMAAVGSTGWFFGSYDTRASQFDQIAFNAPYYLAVSAAGNDRDDFSNSLISNQLNQKFGYDLTKGMQNAKNILTVGAVNQVLNYVDPASVSMSTFSSWGPTDDGRIKPDVVAKGVGVVSTTSSTVSSVGSMNGTSMASPAVSGVALLLQQHFYNLNTNYMRAATLKCLILHTADEAGYYDGPDYEYGWGLINAEKAAVAISGKSSNSSIIDELSLLSGQTYTTTVAVTNGQPLLASISWTDRAGVANSGVVDPSNLYLVNDLDLRVTKNGQIFYPWTLEPSMPYAEASNTTDNFRDNYEKVQVNNPNGVYTITVTNKGTLVGGSQDFSLIVTGSNVTLNTVSVDYSAGLAIYPNPSNGIFTIQRFDYSSDSRVKVYDIKGRLIQSFDVTSDYTELDLSRVAEGFYYVNYTDSNISETKKIVVKK